MGGTRREDRCAFSFVFCLLLGVVLFFRYRFRVVNEEFLVYSRESRLGYKVNFQLKMFYSYLTLSCWILSCALVLI